MRLTTHEGGDSRGVPVVYQHGTPSSGLLYDAWDRSARELGIRLIGFDRPGYGGSARERGRTVADAARDVDEVADELGLERLATWGISGGGPHALACAALCSERLVAVAVLASPTPFDPDGLDWFDGMGEDNLEEFAAARAGEEPLRAYLEPQREEYLRIAPAELREALKTLLGDADRTVLKGKLAEYLDAAGKDGMRNDVAGWVDDDLAFVAPWGFELATIDRPVLLLHGRDDRFVPAAHGGWLAARVPDVDARITDEDGHLTLMERRVHEAHAWLRARLA